MTRRGTFEEAYKISVDAASLIEMPDFSPEAFAENLAPKLAAIGWTNEELNAECTRRYEARKKWWTTHLYDTSGLKE